MSTPTLHVQRTSADVMFEMHPGDRLPSIPSDDESSSFTTASEGTVWHCCKCGTANAIYAGDDNHQLGALACECPHKPCGSCKTTGLVKPFLPMEEPCMVPVSEVDKEIRFGVLCPCCGLSWRAKEIGRYKKTLRKMPSLGFSMAQMQKKRLGVAPGGVGVPNSVSLMNLRRSKSTMVLGNQRIITPPGQTMEKQAQYATVKFSGVVCTCGVVIDLASALCFQIVEPQVDEREQLEEKMSNLEVSSKSENSTKPQKSNKSEKSSQSEKSATSKAISEQRKEVGWSTTPELQEMGHGEPIITIRRRVQHFNPLWSNAVTDDDLKMLEEIRAEARGQSADQ
jgi:hypothetical protein